MWRIGRRKIILSVVAFGYCFQAESATLSLSRNARTYENLSSTLVEKGLANACLSLFYIPDGVTCNPALNPAYDKSNLGIQLQLSNGYSSLSNIQKIMDNEISDELIETVFNEGKTIQIEAGADVFFRSKYLSGVYTPYSLKGFSSIRNEANPDVEFYSIEEQGLTLQTGVEVYKNVFVGLRLRMLERKFIKERFKLALLATDAGKELLKPKDQSVIYAEPAFTYQFDHRWRPRASLMIVNLGQVSKKYDNFTEEPEAQFSVGLSPEVYWGNLDISLDYRSLSYDESDLEKIHLGLLYHFGAMHITSGFDANGISGGVFYELEKINAGIVYSTTLTLGEISESYAQTVYVQIGWQL